MSFKIKKIILFLVLVFNLFLIVMASEDEPTIITDKPTTLTYPSFWHTPFGIHRGTPFWLKVFLGNRTYFNNPQDLAATKLLVDYGNINKGKDDWQLTVYGVNSGNSEIIYNPSMHSLEVFGKEGVNDGELKNPIGIACNEYGDIYIADTGNNRIARFFNDGKKVRFIRNIGSEGEQKGQFKMPTYIALDSMGKIYVSDTGNNRIQVFDKSGGFLYMIGKEKGISQPTGIAVSDEMERYSGYKYNFIYVIDAAGTRILKFDFNGNIIRSSRVNEILAKKVFLTTLEQDYYGNLYVVDNLNSCVLKFDPELNFIASFGSYGKDDYQFEKPTGIAIYKHYGQIFVSDRESAQYFWIGSDMFDFNIEKVKSSVIDVYQFTFFLTEKSYVTIIINIDEKRKITVCDKKEFQMGKNSLLWEVPEIIKIEYLKQGMGYDVIVKITSTYSSYPNIVKMIKSTLIF